MLHPTLLLVFALNLFASNNVLSAYSNSGRVEQTIVGINATTEVPRSVDNSVNTPKSTRLLTKINATDTDKANKDKSEERVPVSIPWIEQTPAALASTSLRRSRSTLTDVPLGRSTSTHSSESLPWSDSTHSTATFSRSASALSSGASPRTASTLSSDADDKMINSVVNQWIRDKETLHSVRVYLHMDAMRPSEYASSPYFKYYDKFASAQVQVWVQEDWSLDRVMSYLTLQYLPADKLKADTNFKYLTEFLDGQIAVWSIQDLPVDEVWRALQLDRQETSATAIQDVTHDYYFKYLFGRLRAWFEDGEAVGDVMTRLGLDKVTGEELREHRNYRAYEYFVEKKLRMWAVVSEYRSVVVAKKLGLHGLRGDALKSHPNSRFLMEYRIIRYHYYVEKMLKSETPTLDVWNHLELPRIKKLSRLSSPQYHMYELYVKALDQYIMERYKIDEIPEKFKSKFNALELSVKTQIWIQNNTPDDYVKFSLGLKGLEGEELKASPTYNFYDKYQDDMEWKKQHSVILA